MPEDKENRGSGVSIDDPYRLAATHPMLGVASQKMLISRIHGEQDKDWFDNGRVYHPNHICEQTIRLPSGQIRKVFFDESALNYNIPIPEDLRPVLEGAAANMRVPDTQLVSRFPLIAVEARTAAEAGKIIVTHLKKAEEQGWVRGRGFFFIDDWRHDYELTRGTEKTVMSFDMRPALLADTKLNLMMFSSLQSLEQVDEVVRRMSEPIEPIDVIARINQLRCMYWTSGAEIWLLPAWRMCELAQEAGGRAPEDGVGIVTNQYKLILNSDQRFAARPNVPPFIYTPELTILLGPTFVHALEWGFYRLVCNFAGRVDALTEDDVLQHAHDLKRWFNTPRRPQPSGQPKYCQDINQTLDYMREFGRGTPMIALVDAIRKKRKTFFARLFGT